jgi:predicted dithiol-disulfide oxidoreductase (DUF899 family)
MTTHPVVSKSEWLAARTALLAKEKAFTRERDALSEARRALPWVKIAKDYVFDGRNGKVRLADLFGPHSQLIVYHFMFGPDWEAGCKSCSFWADNFNSIIIHLNQRDVGMVAISRAPLERLAAFKRRMGWSFEWVSSHGNDFNRDFAVSFTPDELRQDAYNYNFGTRQFGGEEAPGLSVFAKDADGSVFHTYSCYARGLDMLNGAYHHLDLVPKGRDEKALSYSMEWVRLRDEYGK